MLSAPRARSLALGVGALVSCVAPVGRAATLRVGSGGSLAETVARAADGDVVEVPAGVWPGPLVVSRSITVRGAGAIIDGGGQGTVVRLEAPGATLEDLEIRASGQNIDGPDACVFITQAAKGAVVRRSRLHDCAFGIWVNKTSGARLEGNRVVGSLVGHRSERGNAIHLFDADHLMIVGNSITGGRDGIYVSATEDSTIEDNRVDQARYCVHYMYSPRNRLIRNHCAHNALGYALMESDHIHVEGNEAVDNEGHGLLFRSANDCVIVDNRIERNGEGMFFYSSTENLIAGNLIRHNKVGAKIWAGSVRNRVERNRFVGNETQVFYVGATDMVWGEAGPGNAWSDYLGWDHDGDGFGDRPYRVDSLATSLLTRFPVAVLLLRSPALEMVELLQSRMPILRTPTVVDRHPLVGRERAP